jgi:hypothetical protein
MYYKIKKYAHECVIQISISNFSVSCVLNCDYITVHVAF